MKNCNKCKIEKEETNFTSSQLKKKSGWCKSCVSIKGKKWYINNTEKAKANGKKWRRENPEKKKDTAKKWQQANPEKNRASVKKWRRENPEKVKEKGRKWYQNNTEKAKANNKRWKQENRGKINANKRERWRIDPIFRNRMIAAHKVWKILKSQGGSKNGKSSLDYFPWAPEELWTHLESLFEPWMNKHNQGVYDPKTHHLPEMRTWQIDHIIPQSDLPFDSLDHSNLKKSWDLSNLRPLDSKQNILDGATRVRHKKEQ